MTIETPALLDNLPDAYATQNWHALTSWLANEVRTSQDIDINEYDADDGCSEETALPGPLDKSDIHEGTVVSLRCLIY